MISLLSCIVVSMMHMLSPNLLPDLRRFVIEIRDTISELLAHPATRQPIPFRLWSQQIMAVIKWADHEYITVSGMATYPKSSPNPITFRKRFRSVGLASVDVASDARERMVQSGRMETRGALIDLTQLFSAGSGLKAEDKLMAERAKTNNGPTRNIPHLYWFSNANFVMKQAYRQFVQSYFEIIQFRTFCFSSDCNGEVRPHLVWTKVRGECRIPIRIQRTKSVIAYYYSDMFLHEVWPSVRVLAPFSHQIEEKVDSSITESALANYLRLRPKRTRFPWKKPYLYIFVPWGNSCINEPMPCCYSRTRIGRVSISTDYYTTKSDPRGLDWMHFRNTTRSCSFFFWLQRAYGGGVVVFWGT